MGLDISHDCWHGAYSAFMRWRRAVASVCGIDLERMEGYAEGGILWSSLPADPVHILLNHSDCDGEIALDDEIPLAQRLEELAPVLEKYDATHQMGGHLPSAAAAARKFAEGLREAHALGEIVEFH